MLLLPFGYRASPREVVRQLCKDGKREVDKHFMLRFTIDVKTLRCLTLEFCVEVSAVVRDVRAGLLRHHRLCSCYGRRRLFLAVLLPPLPFERHLVRVEPRPRPSKETTPSGFKQPTTFYWNGLQYEPVRQGAMLDEVGEPGGPAVRRAILVSGLNRKSFDGLHATKGQQGEPSKPSIVSQFSSWFVPVDDDIFGEDIVNVILDEDPPVLVGHGVYR